MILKIKHFIKNPWIIFFRLKCIGILDLLPDKMYLKFLYRAMMGKKLNLNSPKTFNEKLQWLKINDRNPQYTIMVDKAEVKKYVAEKIGEEYIIPTLGVWEQFDDIDFESLPMQFVLKCTHDSGGLVICKDKSSFDIELAKKRIEASLSHNFYLEGREWPYKNVKPRIIAEKYMSDEMNIVTNMNVNKAGQLSDYKIHNFNGNPRIILVCRDRYLDNGLTEDFFDQDWNHLDIRRENYPNAVNFPPRPKNLNRMLWLSKVLSAEIPFVRTDFYEINGQLYFGEITLYPASGVSPFVPDSIDGEWGGFITLPK